MLFNYNIDAFNLETIFMFIIPRRQNKTSFAQSSWDADHPFGTLSFNSFENNLFNALQTTKLRYFQKSWAF